MEQKTKLKRKTAKQQTRKVLSANHMNTRLFGEQPVLSFHW